MKPWIKTSLAATLAATALFSGTALAGCGGHGRGWGGHAEWRDASPEQIKEAMGKRVDVQLARMELALALTPEQRPAWADFKKAAQERVEALAKEMESRSKAESPKTALEQLERAEDTSKLHARMLADTRKAVEAFYGKLGAAQKTVFDAEFEQFAFHRQYGGDMGGGYGKGKTPDKGR